MTRNNTKKELFTHTFEYGNHTIEVKAIIKHEYLSADQSAQVNHVHGRHYTRKITAKAIPNNADRIDIGNYLLCALDIDETDPKTFLGLPYTEGKTILSIPEQVERTVRPVLEELDESYQYTGVDEDIEIEVALNRVQHETSVTDIPDELDRLDAEIENLTNNDQPERELS